MCTNICSDGLTVGGGVNVFSFEMTHLADCITYVVKLAEFNNPNILK